MLKGFIPRNFEQIRADEMIENQARPKLIRFLHSKIRRIQNQQKGNSMNYKPAKMYRSVKGRNVDQLPSQERQITHHYASNTTIKARNPNTELSSIAGSAIELAEDVEGGDEADEADAHDKHDGRRDLQSGGVVCVEPQHVTTAAGASADDPARAGATRRTANSTAAHTGRRSRGAARSHDAGSGGRGGRGLGLR